MRALFVLVIVFALGYFGYLYLSDKNLNTVINQNIPEVSLPKIFPTPTPLAINIPKAKTLVTDYHIFQTFNNCGPASLSMALRFYGISVSQKELGDSLRPYQVPGGDNDDKSVTLEELAEKSKEYGFTPFFRPNGNSELVKKFITLEIPVIARTLTSPDEDIGHFRVIKGFDDSLGVFIQDDSLQNKNLKFTYSDFNTLWEKFNFEYLVLIPKDKVSIAESILGEDLNERNSWKKASLVSSGFNKSIALYNIGDFKGSVTEFEKVEDTLPFRSLWYQIEPILAYYELGNYQRVFETTDEIINGGNRAFSELYIIRGKIYQTQGDKEAARTEYEKAVHYNKNMILAQQLLDSLN